MTTFQERYATLTDEELLYIAGDKRDLVEEAAVAVEAEMHKRSLSFHRASRVRGGMDSARARDAASVAALFVGTRRLRKGRLESRVPQVHARSVGANLGEHAACTSFLFLHPPSAAHRLH